MNASVTVTVTVAVTFTSAVTVTITYTVTVRQGVRSFGDNGDFLATVLLTATFAFPQSNPIIREDNVSLLNTTAY